MLRLKEGSSQEVMLKHNLRPGQKNKCSQDVMLKHNLRLILFLLLLPQILGLGLQVGGTVGIEGSSS